MAFRGNIDALTRDRIDGWAWDGDAPEAPVSLVVTADGELVGRCLANRYRFDLETAGIGRGRHAFDLAFSQPLSLARRHRIAVRREEDGLHLPGSPKTIEPAAAFDEEVQARFAEMIGQAGSDEARETWLAFLLDQTNALRQLHADRRSGVADAAMRRRLGWREPDPLSPDPVVPDRPKAQAALVIGDRMPDPGRETGSHAILSHMRSLRRLGYAVTFAPIGLAGDAAALRAEGIACCLRPWYETIEEVLARRRGAFDLVYLHGPDAASRYEALVRHHEPKARVVYNVAALRFLRMLRQGDVEGRPELKARSERVRLAELGAAWHADAVITHSTAEAGLLRRRMRAGKVHVVPWSVACRPAAVAFAERRGLAFIGAHASPANAEAARWLVEAIMPEIWAVDPTIPCLLVGSGMPDGLRHLRSERVETVGFVPDLAGIFDRVRLTVAPLAYGSGLKGKVLDSLAAGIPCVATPSAAEGFGLPEVLARLVAATPADLARAILALHRDEALFRACSDAALAFAADFASEARVDAGLRKAAQGR